MDEDFNVGDILVPVFQSTSKSFKLIHNYNSNMPLVGGLLPAVSHTVRKTSLFHPIVFKSEQFNLGYICGNRNHTRGMVRGGFS